MTIKISVLGTSYNNKDFEIKRCLDSILNQSFKNYECILVLEPNLKINSCNYIVAPWWETNFWEPSVQLALRDLIKPGSIIFDVGANLAGLAILMSRLTGPRGIVCAFEASPRIIELTHGNIIASGCNNIQLYHNAIFSESGKDLMIYAGGHLNDSIYNQGEFMLSRNFRLQKVGNLSWLKNNYDFSHISYSIDVNVFLYLSNELIILNAIAILSP